MRANEVRLYDLEAVSTTIVLREIQPNPDVITIGLYDLDPVNTTVVLRQIPPVFSSGGAVSVETLTGNLILTGYAPTVTISGVVPPDEALTVTGQIVTMFYAGIRRRTKKVKV